MILQGKDLYLSCTIVCMTDTAEGSHKALTSLVNPSTVGALFLQPRTSLHWSSYSACKYHLVMIIIIPINIDTTYNTIFTAAYLCIIWTVEKIVGFILQLPDIKLPGFLPTDHLRTRGCKTGPAQGEETSSLGNNCHVFNLYFVFTCSRLRKI